MHANEERMVGKGEREKVTLALQGGLTEHLLELRLIYLTGLLAQLNVFFGCHSCPSGGTESMWTRIVHSQAHWDSRN